MAEGAGQSPSAPIVFVLDCDNTLLDNDAVKAAMDARLRAMLGASLTEEFWRIYEETRVRRDTVDLPATFAAFRPSLSSDTRLAKVESAIMDFPFHDYLYPDAMATLATLTRHGRPVIVSDGDTVYQPGKIIKSGLAAAVNGDWVVYLHKENHLDEVMARWPGSYYVVIDDKARILAEFKGRRPDRFVTVHVTQGHYASAQANPAPDVTVASIGAVRVLDLDSLSQYLRR
jgi:hypothetical protein